MRPRIHRALFSRRPLRHSVRLTCQVVRERDFKLIADRIVDLSENGMLVPTDDRVLTGETVIVSFMAPYSRVWIDTEATVARVVHGRREGDEGRALGLEFDGLDDVSRALLRRNLLALPPAFPRRGPRFALGVS